MAYSEWQVKICDFEICFLLSFFFSFVFVLFFLLCLSSWDICHVCNTSIINLSSWCVFFFAISFVFPLQFRLIEQRAKMEPISYVILYISNHLASIYPKMFLINWCHSTLKFHHMWKWVKFSRLVCTWACALYLYDTMILTRALFEWKFFVFETQHVHTFFCFTNRVVELVQHKHMNIHIHTHICSFDTKRQKVVVFRLFDYIIQMFLYGLYDPGGGNNGYVLIWNQLRAISNIYIYRPRLTPHQQHKTATQTALGGSRHKHKRCDLFAFETISIGSIAKKRV